MNIDAKRTVHDLAVEMPNASRVFDKLGINYNNCGNKTLWDACTAAGIPVADAVQQLKLPLDQRTVGDRRNNVERRKEAVR